MKTAACALTLFLGFAAIGLRAQDEPILIPDVVDPAKLIPLLPEPLAGWAAEKAEGSSDDVGGFKITNVHRDYQKGDAADAPKTSISITDAVASPDYVEATTGERNKSRRRSGSWSRSDTSSQSNCRIRTRKNCRSGSNGST